MAQTPSPTAFASGRGPLAYLGAVLLVGICTGVCGLLFPRFDARNLAMVYLLGVAAFATRFGRGPSALAACLSVVSLEFLFVPPYFTFPVNDAQYVFTCVVLLLVALLISGLASRFRTEAVERAELAAQAQKVEVEMEREQLRNALLSSVSHDLRTPLASITGAASSLVGDATLSAEARHELSSTIYEESERLNRLVGNLLDMTQVQSGDLRVAKEWQSLEEIVGSALRRLRRVLGDHPVRPHLPPDLPLVPLDAVLIEQVFVNLLENATKYTPSASVIDITVERASGGVSVEVADSGPGLPREGRERIFDKFSRGGRVGLGLAICHAIVTAHGGRILALDRPGGGAAFRFTLPLEGEAPRPPAEGAP